MKKLAASEYKSYSLLLVASLLFCLGLLPTLNLGLLFIFAYLLFATTHFQFKWQIVNIGLWLITLILGLFIAIYRPAGFNYPLIWSAQALYPGGSSFSLFANTSKAIGGYLVVVYLLHYQPLTLNKPSLKLSICVSALGVATILSSANIFFGVHWQPKLPSGILYFILVNLLITVVAEEAFFRLLIQKHLCSFFSNPTLGVWLTAMIASLVFTLAHTTTLNASFLLFLIAGSVYSCIYAYTQRLSLSIAAHFATNILHFLLLEYPLAIKV